MEEPGNEVKTEEDNADGQQTDEHKESTRQSVRSTSVKEEPRASVRASIKEEPRASVRASIKEEPRASVHASIKEEHDTGEKADGEHRQSRSFKGEPAKVSVIQEEGDQIKHEQAEGEDGTGDNLETEKQKNEQVEGEQVAGEHVEGEEGKKAGVGGEHLEEEQLEGEMGEEQMQGEGMMGEHMEGELDQEEHVGEEADLEEQNAEEIAKQADEEMVEEEGYVEEPPPDPAAPYNFSDSKEALKEPYELRPDQQAEVEQLWEMYQNYTPAYTDIDGYITVKELIYMLKCLLIYPFTEEQLYELIDFAVRPPQPDGHINFDQFVKIVKLRQRDFPQEEELRLALQVFDPEKSGILDRDNLKDVLLNKGHKISEKNVMSLVKEVDLTNDGTLGVEDIVGTMAIDMNRDDIILMQSTLNTLQEQLEEIMGVAIRKNDDDEDGGDD